MSNYLSAIDQGLWLSIIVLQFFACWTVLKRGFYNSWKAFSYYLFIMAAQAVVLMIIHRLGSPKTYAISFYVGGFAEAVLLSLVVLEILVKILDPFEALPGRNIARFCFWAVLGISLAVAVSVAMSVNQPIRHGAYFDLPLTIQRTIFLADAALLWAVLFQARSLGITWRSSVAEIAWGFVLFLTVQAMVRFLAVIHSNFVFIRIVSEVGQAAYLCSLCGWIWTMFHRDPLIAPPSAETLTQMRAFNPHALVPKEKIFAAVGVKVNKGTPEPEPETTKETQFR
jgi:hypothetical protein